MKRKLSVLVIFIVLFATRGTWLPAVTQSTISSLEQTIQTTLQQMTQVTPIRGITFVTVTPQENTANPTTTEETIYVPFVSR